MSDDAAPVTKGRKQHRLLERIRAQKQRHSERSRTYRFAFATAGFSLVATGVLLSLPLVPGPGLPLVAVGLAMLALEFDWAERLLERVLVHLERTSETVMRGSRLQRALVVLALVLLAAGLIAAAVVWEVPLLPF